MNLFQSSLFVWGLLGIVGVPLLLILLNELLDRMKRIDHRAVDAVRFLRDMVLPMFALLFMLRFILTIEETNIVVRLISSVFWALAIVAVVRFSRIFLHGESGWQSTVPSLFLRLPTIVIVSVVLVHLLQNVWEQPLGELATTLGLGSVVIAFALQDTLSNLVSGLLLIANSPFKIDEWIHVSDVEGRVVEVNWRYTTLETRNGDLIVFPNGQISADSIENHSRPLPRTRVVQAIDVAYVTPPNRVKKMFMDTMRATPGILTHPEPVVAVTKIDDPMMGYAVHFWIADFKDRPAILNEFMTRVWYASQRYDVPFPSPAFDLYHYDGPTVNKESDVTSAIRAALLMGLPTFQMLPESAIASLAETAQLLHFATSEMVVRTGEQDRGLYVVLSGEVTLCIEKDCGTDCLVSHLKRGEFFGEGGIFTRNASQVDAVAVNDCELLLIQYEDLNEVINQSPDFSAEIAAIITERQTALKRLFGELDETPPPDSLPLSVNLNGAGTHLNGVGK